MKTYQGDCHCGQVRFEIETDIAKTTECNCAICTKKGALHHRILPERFRLLSEKDALSLYQSRSKIAKHRFGKLCGIHPFSNSHAAPNMYSINIRCLDVFPEEIASIGIRQFDGKNWKDAVNTFKF